MADTTFGTIKIGGVILEKDVEGLCEEIGQASLFAGWDGTGDSTFVPKSIDDLLSYAEEQGFLVMSDMDASDGIFESLETFCIEHGIEFDRYASTLYSYPPESKKYRKDLGVVETTTNEDGDNVIHERPVKEALELIKQGKTVDAVKKLEEVVSKDIPKLQLVIFKMNDGTIRKP
jgi:putative N-acetylmannosamine-6-phosphate epimerase